MANAGPLSAYLSGPRGTPAVPTYFLKYQGLVLNRCEDRNRAPRQWW
jgi:hypothetical protein